MRNKKQRVTVLFKDPTIQKAGVPCVVRFVSIGSGPKAKSFARKAQYACLKNVDPDVRVYDSDFMVAYVEAICLVWPTKPAPLAMVLPDWVISRPYLIDRVVAMVEGRLKDYGTSKKISLPDGTNAILGSKDNRLYAEMMEAYKFAEGKRVSGFQYIRSTLRFARSLYGDVGEPELYKLRVPRFYRDHAKVPEDGCFVFHDPVPFTVFNAGRRINDPLSDQTVYWSRVSPDEAVFLDDERGWIG